jgi:formylmethanofuran dehydrogenase subunit E
MKRISVIAISLFAALTLGACSKYDVQPMPMYPGAPPPVVDPKEDAQERKLDDVAKVHGAPGPWAVAGYRMSEYAMKKLGLSRGSFDLEITHHTPKQVKYSCIADGAAAYSGASLGKLNLSLVDAATPEDVVTEYKNKKTGQTVLLKPSAAFATKYADTPRDKARDLGREVLGLPDNQVFEEVPAPPSPMTPPTLVAPASAT